MDRIKGDCIWIYEENETPLILGKDKVNAQKILFHDPGEQSHAHKMIL